MSPVAAFLLGALAGVVGTFAVAFLIDWIAFRQETREKNERLAQRFKEPWR